MHYIALSADNRLRDQVIEHLIATFEKAMYRGMGQQLPGLVVGLYSDEVGYNFLTWDGISYQYLILKYETGVCMAGKLEQFLRGDSHALILDSLLTDPKVRKVGIIPGKARLNWESLSEGGMVTDPESVLPRPLPVAEATKPEMSLYQSFLNLIEKGADISFKNQPKRMELNGVRDWYVRIDWSCEIKGKEYTSEFEGLETAEEAVLDLVNNLRRLHPDLF